MWLRLKAEISHKPSAVRCRRVVPSALSCVFCKTSRHRKTREGSVATPPQQRIAANARHTGRATWLAQLIPNLPAVFEASGLAPARHRAEAVSSPTRRHGAAPLEHVLASTGHRSS
jgi:hypothetical protein